MESKFTCSVLAATLMFSGATVLPVEAQTARVVAVKTRSAAQPTVFLCVQNRNNFATIAQRGDRTTPPLIIWTSTLGGQYNPQERCSIVSQKLTRTVVHNGGKLKNLQLKAGAVRRQVVICVVKSARSGCNGSNMLFTLRPENAKRKNQVLARLTNFSAAGSGAPIFESGGVDSVALEDLNQFLGSEEPNNTSSSSSW